MRPQRLTVVLVGQTGNGKSATANSLLGRDAFAARRSFASVTEGCARQVSWLDEDDALVASTSGDDDAAGSVGEDVSRRTELCVIDTPGTCDSGALLEDNLAHISAHLRGEEGGATDAGSGAAQAGHERNTAGEEKDAESNPRIRESATSAPARVHMFVLVLSAAARFTQEEAVALERLFSRLGEGALRHACVAVTRAEEITRDAEGSNAKTFAAELAKSAPPGLRRLMERMPYHARGAPPVLVENFPTDAYARVADAARGGETHYPYETKPKTTLRFRAAAAPLLAAARDICEAVPVERGARSMTRDDAVVGDESDARSFARTSPAESSNTMTRLRTLNLASCAYEPEQLSRANAMAASDPSVAALAMLDRLKKQLAEGAFGGASGDADRDRDPNGMAAAARRAFEDLAAQFAARAAGRGGRAVSEKAPPATETREAKNKNVFGGLFGGPSDASPDAAGRAPRRETTFAGAEALGGVFEDDAFAFSNDEKAASEKKCDAKKNDVIVRVSGFGDVREARGAFFVGAPGGRLAFEAKKKTSASVVTSDDSSTPRTPGHGRGRARVSGRVSCAGGGFAFVSAGEPTAATMHSPIFLSSVGGPSRVFRASRPVSDDDWVEENAHFVTLTESSSARNGDSSPLSRDGDSIKIVARGAKTGETPDVAFFLDADARFELQGGSLSVWNAAVEASFRSGTTEQARDSSDASNDSRGSSLAFDGVLDVETDVEFAFGAAPADRRAAFREGRSSFPWREKAEDV